MLLDGFLEGIVFPVKNGKASLNFSDIMIQTGKVFLNKYVVLISQKYILGKSPNKFIMVPRKFNRQL